GAVQAYDAISQTIPTDVGHIYQISFSVAENSGCGTCNFSDLSTNGNSTDTGGNGINVTVYAQGGLPVGTETKQGTTIDTNNPATLNQNLVLSDTTGSKVEFDFDY